MARDWLSWRLGRRVGLGLLGLLLVLRGLAFTPLAHGFVEARLEALSVRGQALQIEGLSGDLLGQFSIDRLMIADADGTWTTVDDITASWRTLPLLWGRLHLNDVQIAKVDTTRRPVLAPAEARTSNGSSLLKHYTLKRGRVSEIALAAGIAGPQQAYQLDLSLNTQAVAGDVQLALAPLNGNGDQVDVDLEWGSDVPVRGHAQITGAVNGLIAQILQIPQGEGFRAQIDAVGNATAWDLTAKSDIGGQSWLTLTSQIDSAKLSVDGEASLDKLGAARALAARLGIQAKWSFEYTRGDGALSGTLDASSLSARVSGVRVADAADMVFSPFSVGIRGLNASRLSGLDGLDLSTFSADGQITLSDPSALSFDGTLTAPSLSYGEYQLRDLKSLGVIALADQAISLNTNLSASDVAGLPTPLSSEGRTAANADIAAKIHVSDLAAQLEVFDLQLGDATLSATGDVGVPGALNLSGRVDVPEVDGVGTIAGDWSVNGPDLTAFVASFDGLANLKAAPDTVRELAGEGVKVDLSIERAADVFSIQRASLLSERLSVSARGQLAEERISLDGDASVAEINRGSINTGEISGAFDISGLLSAPILQIELTTPNVSVADQALSNARLRLDARFATGVSGRASLQADVQGTPLTSSIDFAQRNGLIEISSGSATWQAFRLAVTGQFDLEDVAGSSFQADFSGAAPQLGSVDGAATYEQETLNGVFELSGAEFGGVRFDQAELTAAGQWPKFQGEVTYQGEVPWLGAATKIAGDQTYTIDANEQRLGLGGTLSIAGQAIEIEALSFLTISPGLQMMADLRAFDGEVSVRLDPTGAAQSILKMRDVALAEIGALINRPALLGTVSGDADIMIADGGAVGAGTLDIRGLARGDLADAATDLTAEFTIDQNRLSLAADAKDRAQTLDLALTLNTTLTHRGSLTSLRLDPLARRPIRLAGTGQVAPIWALLAPSDLRMDGSFTVDLTNGDGAALRFTGPATLNDGAFEDGYTGLHLKDFSIDAVFEPSGIRIEEANARGARSGRVSARGVYGFDDSGEISVELSGLDAFNRSDVTAAVSGDLSVDRRNRLTRVQGDLEIEKARVDLSRLPKAGYTTLDVTFAGDDQGDPTAAPQREAISLDLGVTADRGIFVDGAGVDTEWATDLRVKGPAGAPQVTGRATLVRGEADLLGRRFRFAEGLIRFIGDIEDTEVQVRAERSSGGITSSVGLSGSLSDPQIELSADPQVPDDEILARVLFGRSPSELSPLQAAQLATAAAQLTGGNAFNLVGQLEAATGLDRLDFGFNDDGAATLSTGKYLAEDVYLEIESGVTGAPGVALEWTPLENVAVDAEIDPELGPKIALQWTQDFDRLPFDETSEEPPK